MQLYMIRVLSLIAIALVYMVFDVFNRRNVPAVFAYATLAFGFVLTLLYFNFGTITESIALSLIIGGVGYVFYKIGQLGAADVIEFVALSLIMPLQQFPLLVTSASQFNIPFIVSLVINTGIIALVIVPIYYIPKAKAKLKRPLLSFVKSNNIIIATILAIVYTAFILFTILVIGLNYIGISVLVLMMVSSFFVMLFSVPITYSMVEYVGIKEFDEGDIIAVNLMSEKSTEAIKKKIKGFDRLLTANIIKKMRKLKTKEKFPVYKEALPFAFPIFLALIITLLFGNLLFFILGL